MNACEKIKGIPTSVQLTAKNGMQSPAGVSNDLTKNWDPLKKIYDFFFQPYRHATFVPFWNFRSVVS